MKLLRAPLMCLVFILSLAQGVRPSVPPDVREEARRLAAEADDEAADLAGRRNALNRLEESARLFLSVGETLEAARADVRAGRLRLLLHAPQEALASHRRALELLRQTPAAEVEAAALNGLGAAYMLLKQKEEAEKVIRQSLALSEQAGYTRGKAEALLVLSYRQNHQEQSLALRTAQEALALWQTLGDRRGLARAHSQVGRCYFAQNILPEAAQHYQQALGIWRELNNRAEQAEALIMLGYVEYRRGEWQNEIGLLTQAQALLDEQAEPGKMGQIATGLGEAFSETGLPENALTHFERALGYYRLTQDPHLVTFATLKIGVTHYYLRKYQEAGTHLEQTLADVEKDSLNAAHCYEYLGRIYSDTGEHDRALGQFQSALDIFTKSGNGMETARVLGLLGQLSERQGRLEAARRHYRRALDAFDRLFDRVNRAAIHYALGRLELGAGNYDAAEDHLRNSVEITEEIRRTSHSRDLVTAFSATIHERYEKYVECMMRRHAAEPSRGLDVRAFEASESGRGRSLTELLRATQTNLVPGLDPVLAEEEKALRQALFVKENARVALLGGAYRAEALAGLNAEIARLESEYKRIDETIRARHPAYSRITRPAAWDLRRIQEQVIADDQTVLLEFLLGADRSYVWAVTRDRVRSYELPARALIAEAAGKAYAALIAPPGPDGADASGPAAVELSRMILAPVASELDKRRVIVVADGALNYIPFQALPSASAGGEPLVTSHEIVNAHSASILGELRREAERRRPAPKILAAFGNPVFPSNYAQLRGGQPAAARGAEAGRWHRALRDIELNGDTFDPSVITRLFYAKRELAYLLDVTGGEGAFVAADYDATPETLLGTDLTQYAIIHFATHGLLDPKRPENSGLVLSTVGRDGREHDGFVGLQNIYELRTPASLVVLSACQTALGKDVRGEGLMGLTRGFMYAGASSVVASLWKVDDEATAELMRQFYSNMLRDGATPAAALRDAQKSIRQRPEWRSPYYWAAFTLQGEYRQVIRPRPAGAATPYGAALSGLALSLLSGGLAWRAYRRRRGQPAGYSTSKK